MNLTVLHQIFYKDKWLRNFLPRAYILGVMSKKKNSAHGTENI